MTPRSPPHSTPRSREQRSGSSPDGEGGDGSGRPDKKPRLESNRTSQACTRCRSLKMRCIGALDPPCRRCRRTGATCEFVARRNAAVPLSPGPYPSHTCTELWRNDVTERLKALETTNARLEGLLARMERGESSRAAGPSSSRTHIPTPQSDPPGTLGLIMPPGPVPPEFRGVWDALDRLKQELPASLAASDAWALPAVCQLSDSFRKHMPGLHFLSESQVSLTAPSPLLSVAILYVAAAHFPSADLAQHQPVYFEAFTRAVGTLSIPGSAIVGALKDEGNGAVSGKFDDVLGIILCGLLAIGWVDTVGLWVNAAYRLLLDGMAEERGRRQAEWRGLWEGLRTIELEHSSLHLKCPSLPFAPPDPPFVPQSAPAIPTSAASSIGELLAIMQHRMPHFVGRGIPTVWETVSSPIPTAAPSITADPDDMAAIRAWAVEIDTWYSRVAVTTTNSNMYIRSITLLNYHLHKLLVLSIFFPLRGLSATAASDREELLDSARVVLKIEATGFEVWSSWDLTIITQASLILLQAWSSGSATDDDLNLIQNHLQCLSCTQQSAPSLRHTLAARLETALQEVRTPTQRNLATLPTVSPSQSFSGPSGPPAAGGEPTALDTANTLSLLSQTALSSGSFSPRGGFLFMDQAPTLGILQDLPIFDDMADPSTLAEWPPYLHNLFGDGAFDSQGA